MFIYSYSMTYKNRLSFQIKHIRMLACYYTKFENDFINAQKIYIVRIKQLRIII